MHGSHAVFVEEIVDELRVSLNNFALRRSLAHHAGCVRIHVECAFWCRAAQPWRIIEHGDNKVPTRAKRYVAFAQKVLRSVERSKHRILADRTWVASRLRLQIRHGLYQPRRTTCIANPPAGHGIGFRRAIHGQRAVIERRTHLKHRCKGLWRVPDMLIHVVGQQHDMRML